MFQLARHFSTSTARISTNQQRYWRDAFKSKGAPFKLAVGVAIGTPVVAIVQGTLLLSDYRMNHGNAPVPPMPQQGAVVVESPQGADSRKKSAKTENQARPLRLLVIGDSLAAGVGMSKSGTPALPVSIARGLSQACGGRVVFWTCIGSPGVSASQIVADIQNMDSEEVGSRASKNRLELLVKEWEAKRKRWQQRRALRRRQTEDQERLSKEQEKLQERLENPISFNSNRQLIKQWWKQVKDSSDKATTTKRYAKEWWTKVRFHVSNEVQHVKTRVQEDLDDIKTIVQNPQLEDLEDEDKIRELAKQRLQLATFRSQQYDIAVVLTGLNDVKDSFMPSFMVNGKNSSVHEGTERILGGWRNQLLTILKVLNPRMGNGINFDTSNPQAESSTTLQKTALPDESEGKQNTKLHTTFPEYSTEPFFKNENLTIAPPSQGDQGADISNNPIGEDAVSPVIVLPALPVAPLEMFQTAPLNWFLSPMFERMDYNKERLAREFSDHVLFIKQPTLEFWREVEAGKGSIVENLATAKVLLTLNDMAQEARDRIQDLMKEHQDEWAQKHEDHQESDGVNQEQAFHGDDSCNNKPQQSKHAQDPDDHPEGHGGRIKNLPEFTTSEGRQRSGSSLIAIDKMHPNDEGYEIWGQHIAAAIVQHWQNVGER